VTDLQIAASARSAATRAAHAVPPHRGTVYLPPPQRRGWLPFFRDYKSFVRG
jgi:hypothetical protein